MFQIEQAYIKRLFELGHFYNPNNPNGHNIKIEDLNKLTLNHLIVVEAIRSFQEIGGEAFNCLCHKFHGRDASFDGSFGPATNQLFNTPRCGEPDYKPPKDTGQKGAVGSGSWPQPCQKAGIKIHIDKSRIPSSVASRWPEIQEKVFAAYHKIGANVVEVFNKSEAHITVWWEALFGSTIGIAQFNSESCNDTVWCKLDTGYTGMVDILWCHELGHNMNLSHTRGGVMNPYIISVDELWSKDDPSYNTLVRYFGGEPVTPPPPTLELKVIEPPKNTSRIEIDFPAKELRATIGNIITKYVIINNSII